jgi:bifunctional non-homologous end joining protein LigD
MQKNQKTGKIPKVKPMLATLINGAFDSPDFIYEIKWDGYRALALIEDGKVALYSRNLKDFNSAYPSIVKVLAKVRRSALFDGEIVAYDQKGLPSFQALQNIGTLPGTKIEYIIFDILYLDGKELLGENLLRRKEILQKVLNKYPALTYSDHIEGNGIEFFKHAVKNNLEGIMAKRKSSKYIPGHRSDSWLKIKHHRTDEAVIAGFTEPRGARSYFGALVLGQYKKDDEFVFVGHTGTGFNEATLRSLYKKMKPLITAKSPFRKKVPINSPITWVRPKLIAELKFTEWTTGGNMRHPVFLGLRADKELGEIKREKIKFYG